MCKPGDEGGRCSKHAARSASGRCLARVRRSFRTCRSVVNGAASSTWAVGWVSRTASPILTPAFPRGTSTTTPRACSPQPALDGAVSHRKEAWRPGRPRLFFSLVFGFWWFGFRAEHRKPNHRKPALCPSSSTVTTCCTRWASWGARLGPNQLAKARAALVGLASSVHDTDPATIVFDAVGAPPGVTAEEVHGLVRVEFATGEEADDRIEWLIAHDAAPKRLVIVSDDHRLQVAGRRRGCRTWKCDEYLDWVKKVRHASRARPTAEKPAGIGPLETESWLAAFGELDRDPAWDELFGPFDEQE